MPKEIIFLKDMFGEKNPLGVNMELETFSLVRLRLISETNILLVAD
jgi:hypothetical protein